MKRLLIIGCGDVAQRALPALRKRYRICALTRTPDRAAELRALGVIPIVGDLDRPHTLATLAGIAHDVLHFAPPSPHGLRDARTAHLTAALAGIRNSGASSLPQHLVYISTTGVYGDHDGGIVAETARQRPTTERAQRRADAERQLRAWGRRNRVPVTILRAPGIYAGERLPLERLRAGTPALRADEDSYSNHIHAEDLAQLAVTALARAAPQRAYNAVDDSVLKMGDYFDLVADRFGLPRPPRVSRAEARNVVSPALWSFMAESRRLTNTRMKRELGFRLRYPTVADGVAAARAANR
jgi:nucleoside-diphosphate-sugar epimerase